MKKFLLFFLLLSSLLLSGCGQEYENWKKVEIKEIGSVKIPNEWVVAYSEGKLYITDKSLENADCNVFFLQTNSFSSFEGEKGIVESNKFCENLQNLQTKTSAVFSNSAIYGTMLFSVDGTEEEMRYLYLPTENTRILLVSWHNAVDQDTLLKIAKSYESDFA